MGDSEDDGDKTRPESTPPAADVGAGAGEGASTTPFEPDAEPAGGRETTALTPDSTAATGRPEPVTLPRPSSDDLMTLRPPAAAAFLPNTVLANRYRIVRFIAQGAMGEVYEAEDLVLHGRVALKTVRPEIARNPQSVERFKREIALARLVTHPNVSRIYDLGLHAPSLSAAPASAPGAEGEAVADPDRGLPSDGQNVLFLTMELLPGETLAAFLARRRRLKRTEALPLLKQIAAGLDAAHAVGVIHRDFKSANVMLVPASDRRKPVRAVVTDFGLARDLDGAGALASISDSGTVVGTPAYRAPEQVEGLTLTPAADLYALGIVAYEMVAGLRPFDGGSAITVALRRLREPPAPPRIHVPDIHPAWDAAILRCLQVDPTGRFPTAGDFVRALETPSTTLDVSEQPTEKMEAPVVAPARPAWLLPGIGATVLLCGVTLMLWRGRATAPAPASGTSSSASTAPSPFVSRRTLSVLGLENASRAPSTAWLSTAISEMLTTDLAAGGQLRTLPGHEVARARAEIGLGPLSALRAEHVAALRERLASDYLVAGSYTLTAGATPRLLRVDLSLYDAATGAELARGAATGNEGQLFDIVFRAGAALREKLGLGRVTPAEALQVEAVLPANPEATRLYVRGLERLRLADAQGARADLEASIALAPKHPMPHAALATAWAALGYDARARRQAREAAGLAGALPPEIRATIEARLHEAEKDWEAAAQAYAGLAASFPDEPDHVFKLAEVQTLGGGARKALVTLEGLRAKSGPGARDPRLALAEARAFQELGEAKEAETRAARAAEQAGASGARLLEARARALLSTARHNQGDSDGAIAAAEEAKRLFEAAGDRGWAARCLERMAIGLQTKGDLRGARRLYESALAAHRRIGDLGSVARVLNNMATDSVNAGKLGKAQVFLDQALAAFRQVDAKYEAAATLSNIGARLQIAGELGPARRRYQQALGFFQELGEKNGIATTLTNLAEVHFADADVVRSQQLHEEALALYRELGDKAGAGYALFRLGELFTARGDLEVARHRFQEAERLQAEATDRLGSAQTRLGLAALALAEGRAPAAVPLAEQAEEVLRAEGAADLQTLALLLLAEAHLAQGKLPEAREASGRAQALASAADKKTQLAAGIMTARLLAASGQSADQGSALASLSALLEDAVRSGLVPSQYEVRLALGRMELAAGRATEGRARLRTLARDATAKGFALIARQARAT